MAGVWGAQPEQAECDSEFCDKSEGFRHVMCQLLRRCSAISLPREEEKAGRIGFKAMNRRARPSGPWAAAQADHPPVAAGETASWAEQAPPEGATVPPPRWQRRFVTAVAVLLALTGGVKLVSVLQESRLLGAADPLFLWLTVRQMLFAAAALELGVAAVLLRRRDVRRAPGLILWLAAVFGAYRLGLWAMGFQGHCRCLGHLFDGLPGFEVWADRVLLAALGVMGAGAVGCLIPGFKNRARLTLALSRRWWRRHGLGVGLAVGCLGGLLSVAAGFAGEPPAPDPAWRIGARGQAQITYLLSDQQKQARFEIVSDGWRVSVRLDGFSPRSSHDPTTALEFHYDGEVGHSLLIWDPEYLVPQMVIDPTTGQPRGDTNNLVRPLNDATMELRFSPIPKDGNLLPPWLAFASLPCLEGWSGGRMEKLFDLERTQRRGPLMVPGVLKRAPHPPHAPELLVTLDPRRRSVTNELFRVEEWQRLGDQTWPKRFVFELYQSHSEPRGRLLTISEWTVEELFVPELTVTGKPQVQGRVDVTDERFNQDPVPLEIVKYDVTNSAIPTVEMVRATPLYQERVKNELQSQRQGRISLVWSGTLGIILVVPVVWLWVTRCNTTRNNNKPH